ncbi:MAG: fasciclin domain-containing protein [Chloroflexi bacterium]|nr:fasciclin domain-containing protein [Chloroflexota bacterium]
MNILLRFALCLFVLLWSVAPVFAQAAPLAYVRFAHLSADAPNVDIYVAGDVLLADVPFATISAYFPLEAGLQQVAFVPAGGDLNDAVIGPLEIEVVAGQDYLFGAFGLVADGSFQRLLLNESALLDEAAPGAAQVLFFNGLSGTPPLDARIEGSDQRFASGLEFSGYEAHTAAPGEYPLVVSLASDSAQILLQDWNPIVLRADHLYFLAALNGAAGEPQALLHVTGTRTLAELLAAAPDLNTLRTFFEAAGLGESLGDRAAPPLTIFAPNDAAFANAFDALGLEPEALLVEFPEALLPILFYHIVDDFVLAATAAQAGELPTLQGAALRFTLDDDTLLLNDAVRVVQRDLLASNGVLHIIEAVLIPPAP